MKTEVQEMVDEVLAETNSSRLRKVLSEVKQDIEHNLRRKPGILTEKAVYEEFRVRLYQETTICICEGVEGMFQVKIDDTNTGESQKITLVIEKK
jgi:hypothetical protein